MPIKEQHITQAEHNRKFWSGFDLDTTPFLDWVVTGIFYEGVHWVEAFLATQKLHSGNHSQRLSAMQHNKMQVGAIIRDLEVLKQDSENARYRCYKHTPNDIRQDLVPIADKIKSHMQSTL